MHNKQNHYSLFNRKVPHGKARRDAHRPGRIKLEKGLREQNPFREGSFIRDQNRTRNYGTNLAHQSCLRREKEYCHEGREWSLKKASNLYTTKNHDTAAEGSSRFKRMTDFLVSVSSSSDDYR